MGRWAEPAYFLIITLAAIFFYFWGLIRFGKMAPSYLHKREHSIPPEQKSAPKMSPKQKFILVTASLFLLSAFSIFIWPTPYQYSTVYTGCGEFTKRTLRFTGKNQIHITKASVPALEKWQNDRYGTAIEIPEVENLAQKYLDEWKQEWIVDSINLEKEIAQWNTQFANRETTITIVDLDKLVSKTIGLDIIRKLSKRTVKLSELDAPVSRKRTGPITLEEILEEPSTKKATMTYKEFCRRELKEKYKMTGGKILEINQMALDDFAAQPGWIWLEWY